MSSDQEGPISSFNWVQTAGPTVLLTGETTATPGFSAPSLSGTLTFELTVTDSSGSTSVDSVNINVDSLPIANAGIDLVILQNTNVTLDGSESSDNEGDISSYNWIQIAGEPVILSDPSSESPAFTTPAISGILTFELTVTDNAGLSSTDTINVTVDSLPIPNAGEDKVVLHNREISLDGRASHDNEGEITHYQWTQTSGQFVILVDPSTATPTFVSPYVSGTLSFALTVTDNRGFQAIDTIVIQVDSLPNVDAGPDKSVLQGSSVVLDASGSTDEEGDINSYLWRQVSGSAIELDDSTAISPSFTAPETSETLVFELTVTDSVGLTATDTVNISVDTLPTAYAGPDIVADQNTTITLYGNVSTDKEGPITRYKWRQVGGIAISLLDTNSINLTFKTPPISEILTFELTVTDSGGFTSTDTVNVTITEDSNSQGGCSISTKPVDFDPTLPILVLLSIAGIFRRKTLV